MASPASNAPRPPEATATTSETADAGAVSNSRPAVDVTAVTTRDDFLLELGESLAGQAAVRPLESVVAALEAIAGEKRGQVVVIDSRDVPDLRADVERLHSQAPQAVLLVFAPAENEKQVGTTLKGSNVFAVLPIPLDIRKTSAVLEGALADAITRKTARTTERPPGVSIETFAPHGSGGSPAAPAASAASPLSTARLATAPPDEPGLKIKPAIWGLAGLGLVAIAASIFFFSGKKPAVKSPSPHPAAGVAAPAEQDVAVAAPAPDSALIKGTLDDLLEKARLAMRERRYSEPAGDNALLYYRSAAAADGASAEAADGLQRVAGVLETRFEEAMTNGRFDEAGLALANLKLATPTGSHNGALELRLTTAQVSRALADGNIERATALVRLSQQSGQVPAEQIARWRAEIARRQDDAKVVRLTGLISERIRDGRLTEPSDDSAKTYVQQLREASSSAYQRMSRDLNSAYLRKAREAAVANRTADSERWLAEAKAGGVSAAELTAFQRELTSARQKAATAETERLIQLARERVRDGRLTDPTQDSAVYYLAQIQANDAVNPAIAPISHDLATKLLDRARSSAQSGKLPLVDADLAQAKRWGADPKDILAVQQLASSSKTPAAGASRSNASLVALAAGLKRVRYSPPEYPTKALASNVAGAVTVEFTVDGGGNTRDIRVIESSPPGVFDRAATAAVRRWRYEPVMLDGAPVEIPVRMAIRFELPK